MEKNKLKKNTEQHYIHKNDIKIISPTNNFVTPLLTDMYQITMAYAYWKNNKQDEYAVFDLFFRKNPFQGEFTVFAGLEEVIRYVSNFHFSEEEIEFLKTIMSDDCEPEFYSWLKKVDCSKIKIYAIPEGTIVFPRIPLIRVEGPIGIAQMLETTLLTLVNYPSLMVTNAARHRLAAGSKKELFEFGLRRAQGVDGGISASRYSYMGGFNGTSNVLASKLFGIPAKGTQAHSYISSYMEEKEIKDAILKDINGNAHNFLEIVKQCRSELAFTNTHTGELISFASYAIAFPKDFLALVDTYDTLKSGVLNFLTIALALHKIGYRAIGIRLDSGDISYLSKESREIFKKISKKLNIDYFEHFTIVASNDLNEETILSLNQQGHEVDSFGIGTNLVTCQAQPALGCVYKLVEINNQPRIKISQEVSKVTLPGKKDAYRLFGMHKYPIVDLMINTNENEIPKCGEKILCLHPFDPKKRAYVTPTKVIPLHKLYWNGKVIEELPSLEELRNYVINQLEIMRPDHLRPLNPTPYKVSVSSKLYQQLHDLWNESVPIPDISLEN